MLTRYIKRLNTGTCSSNAAQEGEVSCSEWSFNSAPASSASFEPSRFVRVENAEKLANGLLERSAIAVPLTLHEREFRW